MLTTQASFNCNGFKISIAATKTGDTPQIELFLGQGEHSVGVFLSPQEADEIAVNLRRVAVAAGHADRRMELYYESPVEVIPTGAQNNG